MRRSFEAQIRSPGTDLRLLAALPKIAVITGCGGAMSPDGPLNPIQATQVGLAWRMARRIMAAAWTWTLGWSLQAAHLEV